MTRPAVRARSDTSERYDAHARYLSAQLAMATQRAVHQHDIAVAIVTYKRPEQLETALRGVVRELSELPSDGILIVVDNDPEQSARAVVSSLSGSVRYILEPRIGIAAARNAAIDAAADCRLIVFVDDDEVPEPGWLNALVGAWEEWGCDAVAGPNIRLFDGSQDPWVAASGFFQHVPRDHGTRVDGAPTSNLLVDLDTIRQLGLRFDDRFGTTGGSDTLFTRQLTAGGGVIRWCSTARTIEPVPVERASRQWVLARDRRVGNSWSRVHLVLARGPVKTTTTALWLAGLAIKLVLTAAARRVLATVTGDLGHGARSEREFARAQGLLMGMFGATVEEYRRS